MSFKRDMSGTLGRNDRREKDSHPTHKGKCVIDGKSFWISAWVKDGRDGSKFFSLAFKPMDKQEEPRSARREPEPQGRPDFDDDIPF